MIVPIKAAANRTPLSLTVAPTKPNNNWLTLNSSGLPLAGSDAPLNAATACAASRADNGDASKFHRRNTAAIPRIAAYNAASAVITTPVCGASAAAVVVGLSAVTDAVFISVTRHALWDLIDRN